MENIEVWKLGLDIDDDSEVSVKATYKNGFCMDSDCIHYFEDLCMEAMTEAGTEIKPYTDEARNSQECKEFKGGSFLMYEVDLTEDDFKGEDE